VTCSSSFAWRWRRNGFSGDLSGVWCLLLEFLAAEIYPLIFPRKLMVGTSFSLTVASNHHFLIATKHRNYNLKV
jgi:hypothetical protein